MTKRTICGRAQRRCRYHIFDKDTIFRSYNLHRLCDVIFNPFLQLHQHFLNPIPWCNPDAHSKATGFRNHKLEEEAKADFVAGRVIEYVPGKSLEELFRCKV